MSGSRGQPPRGLRRGAAQQAGRAGRDRPPAVARGRPPAAAQGREWAAEGVGGAAGALAGEWAPVAARVLLGLVLGWFGCHELVQPGLWTGYVPLLSPTSSLATLAVLAHGWVLLMLAVALVAGIATRLMAGVAAIVLAEIIVSLAVTAGLSDLVLRDVGVFGLAVCLTGVSDQRFALRR
jgi:hypothetical protein